MLITDTQIYGASLEHTAAFHETLLGAGGVSKPAASPLDVMWPIEDVEHFAEIADAVGQEATATIVQKLLTNARALRPVHTFDFANLYWGAIAENPTVQQLIEEVKARAESFGADSLVIVSPTVLTMFQSVGEVFVRRAGVSMRLSNLPIIGDIGTHPVIVDAYGMDNASIIIAAPGWFTFDPEASMMAQIAQTDGDFQTAPVVSDFNLMISPGNINIIDIGYNGGAI